MEWDSSKRDSAGNNGSLSLDGSVMAAASGDRASLPYGASSAAAIPSTIPVIFKVRKSHRNSLNERKKSKSHFRSATIFARTC